MKDIDKLRTIKEIVCSYYKTPDIDSKSRKMQVIKSRQIAVFFAIKFTDFNFSHIGKEIGGLKYSTVIYSIRTIKNYLSYNKTIQFEIDELNSQIEFAININSKSNKRFSYVDGFYKNEDISLTVHKKGYSEILHSSLINNYHKLYVHKHTIIEV